QALHSGGKVKHGRKNPEFQNPNPEKVTSLKSQPACCEDSLLRTSLRRSRISLKTPKKDLIRRGSFVRIDRGIELAAANELLKIANYGFAGNAVFRGQVGDIRFGVCFAQLQKKLMLASQPGGELMFGFRDGIGFGALHGCEH